LEDADTEEGGAARHGNRTASVVARITLPSSGKIFHGTDKDGGTWRPSATGMRPQTEMHGSGGGKQDRKKEGRHCTNTTPTEISRQRIQRHYDIWTFNHQDYDFPTRKLTYEDNKLAVFSL